MSTICAVHLHKLNIPMEPFTISRGTISSAFNFLVVVELQNGLKGWGECSPFPMLVGETQESCFEHGKWLAALLVGKHLSQHEEMRHNWNKALAFNNSLKSAFDMALYDLRAQVAGLPLYAFLGGQNRILITDETIGIDRVENMVEKALHLMNKNAPAIKVKLGTEENQDVQIIRSIREAIGPNLPIRVDANQGWDVHSAISILNKIAPFGIEYCEEPLPRWNTKGTAVVKKHSPIPIMADESVFDEHDAEKVLEADACNLINIKLAKTGSIASALQINQLAEKAGIACMMGSMCESRLGLTASAHVAAACSTVHYADLDMVFTMKADPVLGGIVYNGYEIILPLSPGLGATIDPNYLEKCERLTIQ